MKSLGLKGPGLNLRVEKSRVEMSSNPLPRPNLSSGLKDLAVPELKAKMLFNTSRQSFILNQKNKKVIN